MHRQSHLTIIYLAYLYLIPFAISPRTPLPNLPISPTYLSYFEYIISCSYHPYPILCFSPTATPWRDLHTAKPGRPSTNNLPSYYDSTDALFAHEHVWDERDSYFILQSSLSQEQLDHWPHQFDRARHQPNPYSHMKAALPQLYQENEATRIINLYYA